MTGQEVQGRALCSVLQYGRTVRCGSGVSVSRPRSAAWACRLGRRGWLQGLFGLCGCVGVVGVHCWLAGVVGSGLVVGTEIPEGQVNQSVSGAPDAVSSQVVGEPGRP